MPHSLALGVRRSVTRQQPIDSRVDVGAVTVLGHRDRQSTVRGQQRRDRGVGHRINQRPRLVGPYGHREPPAARRRRTCAERQPQHVFALGVLRPPTSLRDRQHPVRVDLVLEPVEEHPPRVRGDGAAVVAGMHRMRGKPCTLPSLRSRRTPVLLDVRSARWASHDSDLSDPGSRQPPRRQKPCRPLLGAFRRRNVTSDFADGSDCSASGKERPRSSCRELRSTKACGGV